MKKLAFLFLFTFGCTVSGNNGEHNPFRNGEQQVCDLGCTYTMGWYKNHEQWPIDPNTQLCGKSWEEWLNTPPQGDAWIILAHQWITAMLNVTNGAYADNEIQAALADGATIVLACQANDHEEATAISEVLDAFNNGDKSAPHCDDLEEDED